MTTREARRIRDQLIRATHPGTWLASVSPDTVALMRKAALAIAWLETKAEKAEKRAKATPESAPQVSAEKAPPQTASYPGWALAGGDH